MDGLKLLDESEVPVDVDVRPPRMLGRYELLGKLGTGGMATVYLGRTAGEAGFQRLFAIKVLHPHLASDGGFIKMLLDEARLAARLHHPNIVPIVDLGAQDGTHYVAMEYIEGCSLSALLKKRRDERPPRLLVAIALDILAGLDTAHALTDDDGKPMNLVHRDVSPQNVLVGVDGSARITDFGIARAEARIQSTRPGEMKGKIAYMSPEQIKSGNVDRRSDVFAVGGMLWSMLTGRRLFQADNDAATMGNILSMDIPLPSAVGLKPPAVFDAICLCALQRDPGKRFATAGEMEEALRESARQEGLLASHREVGAWVTDAFREELSARRSAIRAVAGGAPGERASTASPAARTMTGEFPSFTPSAVSEASRSAALAAVEPIADAKFKEPPTQLLAAPSSEDPIISVTPARNHKRTAIVGAAFLGALGIVAFFALRSPDRTSSETRPATTPPPAETIAPPPPTQPPSPPPTEVTAPTAATAPIKPVDRYEVTVPIDPPKPIASRPPVPAPVRSRPVAVRPAPAPAPVKPPPVVIAPRPAVTAPPPPTPTKPTPTKPWDKDSPLPPP